MQNSTPTTIQIPTFDEWTSIVPILDSHPTGALLLIVLILAITLLRGKVK